MTPELIAAAERYANPSPADAYPWPCEMHEQPLQRSLDAALLAWFAVERIKANKKPWRIAHHATAAGFWLVGYFDDFGRWVLESTHDTEAEARTTIAKAAG